MGFKLIFYNVPINIVWILNEINFMMNLKILIMNKQSEKKQFKIIDKEKVVMIEKNRQVFSDKVENFEDEARKHEYYLNLYNNE